MANFWKNPRGPFMAVSTPNFASILNSEYSFENSWRALQDLQTFAPLESNTKIAPHSRIRLNFVKHFHMFAILFSQHFFNHVPKFTNFDEFFGMSAMCTEYMSKSPRLSNFLRFRNEYFWNFQKMVFEKLENSSKKIRS